MDGRGRSTVETSLFAVPDFGHVVQRRRLVHVFRSHAPVLTLVCAPAGYGKSVLAAQFARSPVFDLAIWVPCTIETSPATRRSCSWRGLWSPRDPKGWFRVFDGRRSNDHQG